MYTPATDDFATVQIHDLPARADALEREITDLCAQHRADALVTLAETTLQHLPKPLSSAGRYQVVVHVSAETLACAAETLNQSRVSLNSY